MNISLDLRYARSGMSEDRYGACTMPCMNQREPNSFAADRQLHKTVSARVAADHFLVMASKRYHTPISARTRHVHELDASARYYTTDIVSHVGVWCEVVLR